MNIKPYHFNVSRTCLVNKLIHNRMLHLVFTIKRQQSPLLLLPSLKNWPNPLCLMVKRLKMWWPTPLPQELAQPSVLNDDKVKSVVTYSPPPRTGTTLSALWWKGLKCDDLLPSPKNWPNPLCLMMKKLKIWWPTPLPQKLAQPSPLNDEKVKNVVTYSPSPRTGPTLSA